MVGGGGPYLVPEILGQPAPVVQSKMADFEPIFARSTSAVNLSKMFS